jgi:hypothetical protein
MTGRGDTHNYKLTWVIGPTYRDEYNIEFGHPLNLLAYVNTAYPDHTMYEIVVTRLKFPHRTITHS